jgi:hypothetical protein
MDKECGKKVIVIYNNKLLSPRGKLFLDRNELKSFA